MIAAFGGMDVRCARYATFGSPELAENVVEALEDRTACLMANHGMVATGVGMEQAEANIWQRDDITVTPVSGSASRAFGMAGYTPSDMEFAEFYD